MSDVDDEIGTEKQDKDEIVEKMEELHLEHAREPEGHVVNKTEFEEDDPKEEMVEDKPLEIIDEIQRMQLQTQNAEIEEKSDGQNENEDENEKEEEVVGNQQEDQESNIENDKIEDITQQEQESENDNIDSNESENE